MSTVCDRLETYMNEWEKEGKHFWGGTALVLGGLATLGAIFGLATVVFIKLLVFFLG